MARTPTHGKSTLDARFKFADTAFPGGIERWNSLLRSATGVADGEHYLLRLFKKTGTALDEDLKRLITRGLRRVRRVLSSRRARELLVEVLEIVEDQDELGILMLDPGSPICGSSHRVQALQGRLLTTTSENAIALPSQARGSFPQASLQATHMPPLAARITHTAGLSYPDAR
jgi:hypothetical protein